MNSPRNVIAIDRVPVSSLVGYRRIATDSVELNVTTPWESLSVKVPARLTISDKIEDGVRLYTAQLIFRLCQETPGDLSRLAFRCKTADGKQVLIGSDKRPYPVARFSLARPDNVTDSQLVEVTVSYTSAAPIPYIQYI